MLNFSLMKYLKISSKGLMQPEALTLVGASSKRNDDSKIGQFGSGNKFALAYLLRNNHEVKIFSGEEEIKITTERKEFRSEEFDVIVINGEKTSITTQMGKDWSLWQSIREIYSNAIDEGDHVIEMVNSMKSEAGKTSFFISSNNELFDIVGNFNRYFADENDLLYSNKHGKIYKATGNEAVLYRRGIRCLESNKKCLYYYDLPNIDIDENRLVKYSWEVPQKIWHFLFSCTDKEIIKNVLLNCTNSDLIENYNVDWTKPYGELSKEFIEVVETLQIAPSGMAGLMDTEELAKTVLLPTDIFIKIRGSVKEDVVQDKFKSTKSGACYRDDIQASELHVSLLSDAKLFLKECGFEIPYGIFIARFDDPNILGFADTKENRILVSESSMDRGIHDIVNTIIEEYIHLKHRVSDKTREFQYASINELINYMKKVNSYKL